VPGDEEEHALELLAELLAEAVLADLEEEEEAPEND
jgi:hypothetical protein